jgi:cytoskeletal protein CcmA (bactofilin family)
MFDKKDKNVKAPGLGQTNRIVEGTVITGNIESKTDFRLDGILIGNYTSTSKLVIGPSGEVQGDIKCVNVDIEGKFSGKLEVSELLGVKATAKIKGEVIAGKLSVEPGAVFDASCAMKSSLKKTVDEKPEKTT